MAVYKVSFKIEELLQMIINQNEHLLYGITGAGSMVAAFIMEELNINYRAIYPSEEERKQTSFRKISPTGLIPVLVTPKDVSIFESLAIIIHLIETYPNENMIAPIGSPSRARCWQWLSYIATTLYTVNLRYLYPEKFGNPDIVKSVAEESRRQCYDLMENEVEEFLSGNKISAADYYFYMVMDWDDEKEIVFQSRPKLQKIFNTIHKRPLVQKVLSDQPEK